jgi:hypothetical protein
MCEGGKGLGIRTFLLLQIQGNFAGTRTKCIRCQGTFILSGAQVNRFVEPSLDYLYFPDYIP